MYYPKSQVKTALYTNGGEFSRADDNQNYTGYYWKNSKGQYYSGKSPNDTNVIQLLSIETNDSEESSLPARFSFWTNSYPNQITNVKPGLSPQITFPKPTKEDYTLGIYTRYFTKKSNQNIYYEISKDSYTKIINKDSSIKWELYEGIQLNWVLSGKEKDVYSTNKNTVHTKEENQKLPGFSKIFREDYLQYYKD